MNTIFKFLLLNFFLGLARADLCSENVTLNELPGGVVSHVISTVMHTIRIATGGCPEPLVNKNDVKFLLYTRKNSHTPITLNPDNPNIDRKKPIKILMPGWLCSLSNDRMPELKDAYLKRYDANIIGVDWSAISLDVYPAVFCNIPGVAKITAEFLYKLRIDFKKIHLVGHSMGAHLAGLVGQEVTKKYKYKKQIGRITGLDPAGPFYQSVSESQRLDASDALFVDVIHSNMGMLGYYGPCGTADFYVNCGFTQPGCSKKSGGSIFERIKVLVACSHLRAADYMVESIISKGVIAKSCRFCPALCFKPMFPTSSVKMGEDCPHNPRDRKYSVDTTTQKVEQIL